MVKLKEIGKEKFFIFGYLHEIQSMIEIVSLTCHNKISYVKYR